VILALGSAADGTFLHLLERLRGASGGTGRRVVAVDVVHLALAGAFRLDPPAPASGTLRVGDLDLAWGEVSGVWVRLPDLAGGAPDEEGRRLVTGVHRALATAVHCLDVPVVNPPLLEPSNASKVAHLLYLARLTGLAVPESCLTDDPGLAAAFVDEHGGDVIYKGASSAKTWVRAWAPGTDACRLPLVARCPVLFQRRVRGPDVRVHVAAGDLHAERIDCPRVDYRLAPPGTVFAPARVPDRVARACREMSVSLDAPLLGVDLKVDARTGEWFLLEANAMPCFEGYDRRAGGAISASLVRYLTGAGPAEPSRLPPLPGRDRVADPVRVAGPVPRPSRPSPLPGRDGVADSVGGVAVQEAGTDRRRAGPAAPVEHGAGEGPPGRQAPGVQFPGEAGVQRQEGPRVARGQGTGHRRVEGRGPRVRAAGGSGTAAGAAVAQDEPGVAVAPRGRRSRVRADLGQDPFPGPPGPVQQPAAQGQRQGQARGFPGPGGRAAGRCPDVDAEPAEGPPCPGAVGQVDGPAPDDDHRRRGGGQQEPHGPLARLQQFPGRPRPGTAAHEVGDQQRRVGDDGGPEGSAGRPWLSRPARRRHAPARRPRPWCGAPRRGRRTVRSRRRGGGGRRR